VDTAEPPLQLSPLLVFPTEVNIGGWGATKAMLTTECVSEMRKWHGRHRFRCRGQDIGSGTYKRKINGDGGAEAKTVRVKFPFANASSAFKYLQKTGGAYRKYTAWILTYTQMMRCT
jgi:hypothetical protein